MNRQDWLPQKVPVHWGIDFTPDSGPLVMACSGIYSRCRWGWWNDPAPLSADLLVLATGV